MFTVMEKLTVVFWDLYGSQCKSVKVQSAGYFRLMGNVAIAWRYKQKTASREGLITTIVDMYSIWFYYTDFH